MSHRLGDGKDLAKTCFAFILFSLCASATYVFNDLLDLEKDRQHPQKKLRPLAAGLVSPATGWKLLSFLLCLVLAPSFFFSGNFTLLLGLYFCFAVVYSFYLKKIVLMDVMTLAFFYTLRIFAGSMAAQIPVSSWLLAFSIFIFLSLAFLKRFSEVQMLSPEERLKTGRGYRKEDLTTLSQLGTSSAYLAVLVMALYVSSADVAPLYSHPRLLWFLCPIILYWVSRVWFLGTRGEIHEDPILFALRDPASYVSVVLSGTVVWMAL